MSGAFDSDNTSGSAWLGSSTRNLNKRARGNAWKKHSDLADAFLAGKEQHTDTARKNFSLSAACRAALFLPTLPIAAIKNHLITAGIFAKKTLPPRNRKH
ncbi:hypothetical protein RQN30_07850 [Arcanobacterium hippocoleae]